MAKKSGSDKNYISVWQWLLLFLLFGLPCFGLIFLILFAFIGENESRKNYCRAFIILLLLGMLIWFCLVSLGLIPMFIAAFQNWQQQHHYHWHF